METERGEYQERPPLPNRTRPRIYGVWRTLMIAILCYAVAAYAGTLTSSFWAVVYVDRAAPELLGEVIGAGDRMENLTDRWLFGVQSTAQYVGTIALAIVGLCFLYVIISARCFRLTDYLGPFLPAPRVAVKYTAIMGVLLVAQLVCLVVWALMKGAHLEAKVAYPAGSLLVGGAAMVIAGPAYEEVLFRGFLFRGIASSRMGGWGALIVTTMLFTASHLQYYLSRPEANPAALAWVFLLAFYWGWVRLKSGSTGLAVLLHALNNLVIVALRAGSSIELT